MEEGTRVVAVCGQGCNIDKQKLIEMLIEKFSNNTDISIVGDPQLRDLRLELIEGMQVIQDTEAMQFKTLITEFNTNTDKIILGNRKIDRAEFEIMNDINDIPMIREKMYKEQKISDRPWSRKNKFYKYWR